MTSRTSPPADLSRREIFPTRARRWFFSDRREGLSSSPRSVLKTCLIRSYASLSPETCRTRARRASSRTTAGDFSQSSPIVRTVTSLSNATLARLLGLGGALESSMLAVSMLSLSDRLRTRVERRRRDFAAEAAGTSVGVCGRIAEGAIETIERRWRYHEGWGGRDK
jgi:hypothetical protein